MMQVFNVFVAAISAIWFLFNVGSAAVQSAYDGEFLGKRYSSVWMPVRTLWGAALIIPAFGGWNLAQLLMALMASAGIGGANLTASANPDFVKSFASAAPVPNPINLAGVLDSTRPALSCFYARRIEQERLRAANMTIASDMTFTEDASTGDQDNGQSVDEPILNTQWGVNYATIGSSLVAQFGAVTTTDNIPVDECGTASFTPMSTDGKPADQLDAINGVNAASEEAFRGLINDSLTAAEQLIGAASAYPSFTPTRENQKAFTARLSAAVAARQAQLNSSIASIQADAAAAMQEHLTEMVNSYGWIGYGMAPIKTAVRQIAVLTDSPEVSGSSSQGANQTSQDASKDSGFFSSLSRDIKGWMYRNTDCVSCNPEPETSKMPDDSMACVKDLKACIERPMLQAAKSGRLLSVIGAASGNPLVAMPAVGAAALNLAVDLIWVYLLIIVGVVVATGIAGVASLGTLNGAASIVGNLLLLIGGILLALLAPLVTYGLQLLVFVPFTITIAWIFAVGGWIVIVFESFVGSTLWAMAHMDPEGEGMGQRTTHGYLFILNLLFRPSIIVMSLFVTYQFIAVIGGMANSVISVSMGEMLSASTSSLFMFFLILAGGLMLLTQVNLAVIDVGASLIQMIPNQIFTWLGGQFGSNVGSGVEKSVTSSASQHADQLGNMSRGLGEQLLTSSVLKKRRGANSDPTKKGGEKGAVEKGTKTSLYSQLKSINN